MELGSSEEPKLSRQLKKDGPILFGPENTKHIEWRQKNLLVTLDLETILKIVCLKLASVVLGGASVLKELPNPVCIERGWL